MACLLSASRGFLPRRPGVEISTGSVAGANHSHSIPKYWARSWTCKYLRCLWRDSNNGGCQSVITTPQSSLGYNIFAYLNNSVLSLEASIEQAHKVNFLQRASKNPSSTAFSFVRRPPDMGRLKKWINSRGGGLRSIPQGADKEDVLSDLRYKRNFVFWKPPGCAIICFQD